MKRRDILSWAGALLMISGIASYASAQGNSSTMPEDKGNTAWTGGARDQPSQSQSSGTTGKSAGDAATQDAEAVRTQPLTATGSDLEGPPQQFPADKTPE